MLDVLEELADVEVEFAEFLKMLPAMRVRQYSISSSSLQNPTNATLTVSVLDAPAISGQKNQRYLGVASNYLARLNPGDKVQMVVRPSAASFHPPQRPHGAANSVRRGIRPGAIQRLHRRTRGAKRLWPENRESAVILRVSLAGGGLSVLRECG